MSERAQRPVLRLPDWRVLIGMAVLLAGGGMFALAYSVAPTNADGARGIFWAGVILAVLGFGVALAGRQVPSSHLLALCGLLAVVFYLPKLGRAPHDFIFFDELQHVRAVADVVDGMRLFIENPLNPLAAYYPALSSLTGVLVAASGLSIFAVGNILMVAARLLMLFSLFVLYRRLFEDDRLAALGTLLYTANPAFFFFDAQFSYESLALPLVVAIFTISLTPRDEARGNWGPMVLCVAFAPAVVLTHHVSSWSLVMLFLVFGATMGFFEPRPTRYLSRRLLLLGAVTATLTALWWLLAAPSTWSYLSRSMGATLNAVPDFFAGGRGARTPFEGGSSFSLPPYEVWGAYAGVILLGLCFAAGSMWAWRHEPLQRGRYVACVLIGCTYFFSFPIQLLQKAEAAPIAPRIWEVAFIGLAPVAALALQRIATIRWPWTPAIAGIALIFILGSGVVIRSGDNIRFPGPYVPSSGPRATTPETIAAARWLARNYGNGRVVMGDFTVASVFGAYAKSQPASYQNYGIRPWRVFFSNVLTGAGRFELDRSRTEFVVVDRRITTAQPFTKFYFSDKEPKLVTPLLPVSYLTKFDTSREFELVYDSGTIQIYWYRAADD